MKKVTGIGGMFFKSKDLQKINIEKVLIETSAAYSQLSAECRQDFIVNLSIRKFQRGDLVVREGQFAKKAYMIVSGCSRAFYLKERKDITDWFTFENQFMASIVSFFSDKLLVGKTARIICTLDQPAWYCRWAYGNPSHNALKKGTLNFIGVKKVKITTIGPVRLSK